MMNTPTHASIHDKETGISSKNYIQIEYLKRLPWHWSQNTRKEWGEEHKNGSYVERQQTSFSKAIKVRTNEASIYILLIT